MSTAALAPIDRVASSTADLVLLVGRIAIGWIFVQSGYGKVTSLLGFAPPDAYAGFLRGLVNQGVPIPSVLGVVGAFSEIIGGVAVVLGLWTRPAALLLLVFTIIATAISHKYWTYPADQMRNQNAHFFKNVAIIGGFCFLFVSGAGRVRVE